MIEISQIKIPFASRTHQELMSLLTAKAAKILHVRPAQITRLTVVRHTIDARKKTQLYDVYSVTLALRKTKEERVLPRADSRFVRRIEQKEAPFSLSAFRASFPKTLHPMRPVIAGTGPAGLFCAMELLLRGFSPILIERGKSVEERREDVSRYWEGGTLDAESNVQFGEGGAGTFSDGKLYTSVRDREGLMHRVLSIFHAHGAGESILTEADPHIGTDALAQIVSRMRETILLAGGEVCFSDALNGLVLSGVRDTDGAYTQRITAVKTARGILDTQALVLATGHSARDTFEMLATSGVRMEQKAFAAGFRILHPQESIDLARYGRIHKEALPPASYKLTTRVGARSVYTFCMCPGGFVIDAASEPGGLCVNGMSNSLRDAPFANSAVICTVTPADYDRGSVLDGIRFQRLAEQRAYAAGAGAIPVMRLSELAERLCIRTGEGTMPVNGALPLAEGIRGRFGEAAVDSILPEEITRAIAEGISEFGKKIRGFDAPDAWLCATESRTSSPVRIVRDKDMQSVNTKGLFPCGEGAGYAGGIMSAAIDGIRVAGAVEKALLSAG